LQLVVDRNVIRRGGLSEAATDREKEFVLTDTFLVEMVKHPEQWAKTVKKDFAALIPFGDRLWLSSSVGEALRTELIERRAVTREELLPQEFRPLLGELMQVVAGGSELSDTLLEKIGNILPSLRAEQPDLKMPKVRTEYVMRKLEKLLRPEIVSDLRNGKLQGDAKLCLVEDIAIRIYEADCAAHSVKMLPMPGSMVSRFFILKVWRAMSWLQHSGLDAAAQGKLYNDAYDDEYVLVGSFFDGTLSAEKRVNEADAALRRIVESASSDRLVNGYCEYKNAD
jgi:hypothetical protein